jgi:hypothetical protein
MGLFPHPTEKSGQWVLAGCGVGRECSPLEMPTSDLIQSWKSPHLDLGHVAFCAFSEGSGSYHFLGQHRLPENTRSPSHTLVWLREEACPPQGYCSYLQWLPNLAGDAGAMAPAGARGFQRRIQPVPPHWRVSELTGQRFFLHLDHLVGSYFWTIGVRKSSTKE